MKLVMTYEVTDEYTYSVTTHDPIEYESIEALYCYIDDMVSMAMGTDYHEMDHDALNEFASIVGLTLYDFIGHNSDGSSYFREPHIQTLEDWFERCKVGKGK